jgi:hypothetical protein
MYMRYAGDGIGHYKVDLMEGSRNSAPPPEPAADSEPEDAFDTSDIQVAGTGNRDQDASFPTASTNNDADNADDGCDFAEEDSGEDSESDHEDLESEHELEGSETYDEGGIEGNFGAEDGEGMFGDVEDDEGYAPL